MLEQGGEERGTKLSGSFKKSFFALLSRPLRGRWKGKIKAGLSSALLTLHL